MHALHIYAGASARATIARNGLSANAVCTIPAAAGGPKGLVLGALDRFIFGEWLHQSQQPIDLIGASIGAWRMSAACFNNPRVGLAQLEYDYIHQHYLDASQVSAQFTPILRSFYQGRESEVLNNPRYRLHVITARGRHLLRTEHPWLTPLGYAGAFVSNLVQRKALGLWLERVVFSSPNAALPFATTDFPTRQVPFNAANLIPAVLASCSIPFVLDAVSDIPNAPAGAYWDGGITDYHLHLHYRNTINSIAGSAHPASATADMDDKNKNDGIILYPHFQQAVVPGWLDKHLPWRHRATAALDHVVLLAPNPEWIKTLPNGKLPDRTDFAHYGNNFHARVHAWNAACSASQQLADEFAAWLERPDSARVQTL